MSSRLNVLGLSLVFEIMSTGPLLSAEDASELKGKAESGLGAAQSSLADAYYLGNGVLTDAAEAVRRWQKAAEQGDLESQMSLGNAYQLGAGVAKNYAAAAR